MISQILLHVLVRKQNRCDAHVRLGVTGYLMGVPVTSYSLGIGQEHVEFAEAKIQARIITRDLTDAEIDALAVVSVAGELNPPGWGAWDDECCSTWCNCNAIVYRQIHSTYS
jgi:hypothetical protein